MDCASWELTSKKLPPVGFLVLASFGLDEYGRDLVYTARFISYAGGEPSEEFWILNGEKSTEVPKYWRNVPTPPFSEQ